MYNKWQKAVFLSIFCILLGVGRTCFAYDMSTRIKDIAQVQGVRSNQLVGYGLVIGLPGTGDSNKTLETLNSIANMLQNFGVNINPATLKPKNVAAVMVTATLPPFAQPGQHIDFTASSIGDAKSLSGGILLQTPLRAGNGLVYAVAQGAIATGGFSSSGQSSNISTSGISNGGAIVERGAGGTLGQNGKIVLTLNNPDFSTAARIATAISNGLGVSASAVNPAEVDVSVPAYYQNNLVGFVANIENLSVVPGSTAKVVVNERTGTIVMGGNITVNQVAIAQGGLSISIERNKNVSQPPPFSLGSTIVTKNTKTSVKQQKASTIVLDSTANVNDIVGALNAVGATPRDIISILQAMKESGALHAQLEVI